MNLTEMIARVRQDLHDEDPEQYRWEDSLLSRHITHAVKDFSQACPRETRATLATLAGSREIDVSALTDRIRIEAVEYPAGLFPKRYSRFSLWSDVLTLLGEDVPDGTDCNIYYGRLHTLDEAGSSIPSQYEDIIATGTCGYAATELGAYAINRVNIGGADTLEEFLELGQSKLTFFRAELKRLTRRLSASRLYVPDYPAKSQNRDYGT
jgi:hypothetical protein